MGIQSDYWKQQCTIRWVQVNGETPNTFMPEPLSVIGIILLLGFNLQLVLCQRIINGKLLFFNVSNRG
jgi:hypothetical protein